PALSRPATYPTLFRSGVRGHGVARAQLDHVTRDERGGVAVDRAAGAAHPYGDRGDLGETVQRPVGAAPLGAAEEGVHQHHAADRSEEHTSELQSRENL